MQLIHNDCLSAMRAMPNNSIHTIITDPPYGIVLMGKDWDKQLPSIEIWAECLRIARPGAILMAMGSARTYHRLAYGIEDAGWNILPGMMWIYGSSFAKGANIEKKTGEQQWQGYKTQLKTLYEPIIVAMKPIEGTFAQNALEWGVAGFWIDGGRIPSEPYQVNVYNSPRNFQFFNGEPNRQQGFTPQQHTTGRYPSNVIFSHITGEICQACDGAGCDACDGYGEVGGCRLVDHWQCVDGCPVKELDEQSGFLRTHGHTHFKNVDEDKISALKISGKRSNGRTLPDYDKGGGASRFFYSTKSSPKERAKGLRDFYWRVDKASPVGFVRITKQEFDQTPHSKRLQGNIHPTVKPVSLMQYLARLTRPPSGGVVLDPFMGSGSTGIACVLEDRDFIGIEMQAEYIEIAQARIDCAMQKKGQRLL